VLLLLLLHAVLLLRAVSLRQGWRKMGAEGAEGVVSLAEERVEAFSHQIHIDPIHKL